ncbi:MAG: L,D-transpeptidase [Pseudomonadota bacterium]
MVSRRHFLGFLAGGSVAASQLGFIKDASAERVFNYTERRWETVDPNVIRTDRRVPSKYKRRNVAINTSLKPGTIVIHTDGKFLYHVTSQNKAVRYGVGVGREGFTWKGDATIRRKAEWPTWTPPAEMRARELKKGIKLPITQAGGIDNPLGARALYLYQGNRDTLYRIHGTNQPWSIGLNLSSGCIRMLNSDVEHLYNQVKLGSKVVVVGPGENLNKALSENMNPFAALFSSN